jgi:hypothetical protein
MGFAWAILVATVATVGCYFDGVIFGGFDGFSRGFDAGISRV